MRFPIAILALTFSLLASASQPDATTRREVDHLLSYLQSSKCTFNRNGAWYDSSEARTHLSMKYKYLVNTSSVPSAESFIDEAASKSSVTGRPYLVKCGEAKEMESGVWLKAELASYRKTSH